MGYWQTTIRSELDLKVQIALLGELIQGGPDKTGIFGMQRFGGQNYGYKVLHGVCFRMKF